METRRLKNIAILILLLLNAFLLLLLGYQYLQAEEAARDTREQLSVLFASQELELSVQYEVMAGSSGTNGWPMQIIREGIATAVLSVPLRYMHTPIETVHGDDLTNTAKLLAAFVRGLGEEAEAL